MRRRLNLYIEMIWDLGVGYELVRAERDVPARAQLLAAPLPRCVDNLTGMLDARLLAIAQPFIWCGAFARWRRPTSHLRSR